MLREPFAAHLIAFAGALIVVSWLLLGLNLWYAHVQRQTVAREQAAAVAHTVEERVERPLQVADQLLQLIGKELAEKKSRLDGPTVTPILRRLDPQLDEILSIGFVNAQGISLGHSNPRLPVGLDYRGRDYFHFHSTVPERGLFIDKPLVGQASGQRVFTASRRVSGTDDTFLGVLVAVIRTDALAADFAGLTIGHKGAISLFHIPSRSIVVRQPDYQETFGKILQDHDRLEKLAQAPQGFFRGNTSLDGEERIVAYRRIKDLPLAVWVGLSANNIRATLLADLAGYLTMAVLLNGLIAGGAFVILAAHRREVGLKASMRRWQQVFEHASWGMAVSSADGTVLEHMNPAYAHMHGYSVAELTGQTIQTVCAPEVRKDIPDLIARICKEDFLRYESLHVRRDGHVFPVLIDASIVRNNAGEALYRIVNVQDISKIRRVQDEKRIARDFFQHTFDAAPVGMAIVSIDGCFTQVNRAMCEFTGYSEKELLTMHCSDITHPENVEQSMRLLQSSLNGQCPSFQQEKRYVCKNGQEVWGLAVISPVSDTDGRPLHLIAQVLDIDALKRAENSLRISERKLAEAALKEGEKFKQAILDAVSSQIAVLDHDGVIVAVNESWQRFALDNSEPDRPLRNTVVGCNYLDICQASLGESRASALEARDGILMVIEGHLPSFHFEYPCHSPHRQRWFSMSVTSLGVARRGVVIAHSDITDSKQQLRALAAHHEVMLELVRKHIAREIHDELGQLLTALKMDISVVRLRFGENVLLVEMVEEMRGLVDKIMTVVRQVASNLRPAALDHGLLPAIEWLTEDFTKRWSISCWVKVDDGNIVLEDRQSTAVFRVVQESLTNVARHSGAQEVVISLNQSGQRLQVVVRDDGMGFDMLAMDKARGFGLFGMRERMLALGGTLSINSAPGKGTAVSIEIPFLNRELS